MAMTSYRYEERAMKRKANRFLVPWPCLGKATGTAKHMTSRKKSTGNASCTCFKRRQRTSPKFEVQQSRQSSKLSRRSIRRQQQHRDAVRTRLHVHIPPAAKADGCGSTCCAT